MYGLAGWSKATFTNPFTLIIFIQDGVYNKVSKLQIASDSSILAVRVLEKTPNQKFHISTILSQNGKINFCNTIVPLQSLPMLRDQIKNY